MAHLSKSGKSGLVHDGENVLLSLIGNSKELYNTAKNQELRFPKNRREEEQSNFPEDAARSPKDSVNCKKNGGRRF